MSNKNEAKRSDLVINGYEHPEGLVPSNGYNQYSSYDDVYNESKKKFENNEEYFVTNSTRTESFNPYGTYDSSYKTKDQDGKI
jgi:hypothetical protein